MKLIGTCTTKILCEKLRELADDVADEDTPEQVLEEAVELLLAYINDDEVEQAFQLVGNKVSTMAIREGPI